MDLNKLKNLMAASVATKSEAYKAGFDCGIFGANTDNCHFKFFGSKSLMEEWTQGKRDGEAAKASHQED